MKKEKKIHRFDLISKRSQTSQPTCRSYKHHGHVVLQVQVDEEVLHTRHIGRYDEVARSQVGWKSWPLYRFQPGHPLAVLAFVVEVVKYGVGVRIGLVFGEFELGRPWVLLAYIVLT